MKIGDLVKTTTNSTTWKINKLGILINFVPRHDQWCQVHMVTGELVKIPWKHLKAANESR